MSYLPAANTVKRRISLFTREEQKKIAEARRMRGLPDLSAMMASLLGLPRVGPSDPPKETMVVETSDTTLQRRAPSPDATASAPKKRKGQK